MAQVSNSPTQSSRIRSIVLFAGISLVLLGLVGGGIWFAKQRSHQLATASHPNQTATTDKKPDQAKPQNQSGSNNPQPQQQAPPQDQPATPPPATSTPPQPAPAPVQTVPSTGPSHLPSTGPNEVGIIFSAIVFGGLTYVAVRSWQNRTA